VNTRETDLLFRNILLFDGSGAEPLPGDLAVAGDRITAVGPGLAVGGREVVDGDGMALAPGFIDIHTHDDAVVLHPDGMVAKLTQGVTTVVTGNCGISLAPGLPPGMDLPTPPLDLLGLAEAFSYDGFGDYLAALRAFGPAVNVLPLVGHTLLRLRAMGDCDRPATPEEIGRMRAELADALTAGAIGLSTGLAYPPARYASTEEVFHLVADVASAGALWTTHMRDERAGVVSAVAETLDIARRSGARTLISHHKCCGAAAFGLSRTTLEMIAAARRELPLDLDVYPYTASSTVLNQAFARDSKTVTISWSDPHPACAGRTLTDVAAEWGMEEDAALERLKPGGAIYHQMCEQDLRRIMAFPATLVGSDGLPRGHRPHPRLWGTFPRVLGHYARDEGIFGMETAVAKMSGQTAAALKLTDRGYLRAGYKADLVVFDPARIADVATYDDPIRPACGISSVYVNGSLAVREGVPTGVRAGSVISVSA
jgi:N-acyl-D-aspartate/D-glutamate deacylase